MHDEDDNYYYYFFFHQKHQKSWIMRKQRARIVRKVLKRDLITIIIIFESKKSKTKLQTL
jgi:hypothetical protein